MDAKKRPDSGFKKNIWHLNPTSKRKKKPILLSLTHNKGGVFDTK